MNYIISVSKDRLQVDTYGQKNFERYWEYKNKSTGDFHLKAFQNRTTWLSSIPGIFLNT